MKPHLLKLVEEAKKKHAERMAAMAAGTLATEKSAPASSLHIKSQPETKAVLTSSASGFETSIGVDLNEEQRSAVELAMRGKSFNLIGAAGTGKTTTTREIIAQLSRLPHILPIGEYTKYLNKDSPGIVIISFTNKAVNNIKKFLSPELQKHCLTYHKLLQYQPVKAFDELELHRRGIDPEASGMFIPTFWRENPLPHISCVIVEESSMVGDDLHRVLLQALPNPEATQFIFLGDLNQLPPIFGPSILGFKIADEHQPTVELKHVYRQALESPIITLAHKIREGRGFSANGKGVLQEAGFTDDRGTHGKVTIRPWKKKIESGPATKVCLANFVLPLVTQDGYDFNENIILCPFNKSFGTIELNRSIADALAKKRDAEVHEVIARGTRSYWATGDRVLVDRREAVIVKIEPTPGYGGKIPRAASKTLDRWGRDPNGEAAPEDDDVTVKNAKEFDILDSLDLGADDEGAKNKASHTITVEFVDSGVSQSLSTAGEINGMLFSYVLTVHKSQGSEWKRVFILLHYSHNTMLSRELLYTAITRARQELFIICEPDRGEIYNSLTRAAKSPEIHGVTLEEKARYFMAKKKSMQRLGDRKKQQELDIEEGEE